MSGDKKKLVYAQTTRAQKPLVWVETPEERATRLEGYKYWRRREILTNPLFLVKQRIKSAVSTRIEYS